MGVLRALQERRRLVVGGDMYARRPDDIKAAYIVRAVNLKYVAKRKTDGTVICETDEKTEARAEAMRRGFTVEN